MTAQTGENQDQETEKRKHLDCLFYEKPANCTKKIFSRFPKDRAEFKIYKVENDLRPLTWEKLVVLGKYNFGLP